MKIPVVSFPSYFEPDTSGLYITVVTAELTRLVTHSDHIYCTAGPVRKRPADGYCSMPNMISNFL